MPLILAKIKLLHIGDFGQIFEQNSVSNLRGKTIDSEDKIIFKVQKITG